jgi:hypothetical protein
MPAGGVDPLIVRKVSDVDIRTDVCEPVFREALGFRRALRNGARNLQTIRLTSPTLRSGMLTIWPAAFRRRHLCHLLKHFAGIRQHEARAPDRSSPDCTAAGLLRPLSS